MEFHPGFSPSHGLHSAKEGVKYTRTYCLLKMRVASTPLHPHHIHIITAEYPTMNRERGERTEREKGITSLSHPVLLQSCQFKCQDSLNLSPASAFKDHTSPRDLDLEASRKRCTINCLMTAAATVSVKERERERKGVTKAPCEWMR